MLFFVIFGLLLMLVLYHIFLHYSRRGRILNRLRGPPILPILGNALQVNVSTDKLYKLLREYGVKYYPIFRMWFADVAVIQIRHPDDLEIVLTSTQNMGKKFGYEEFHPWLKTGLITSTGDKWQYRRKILTPSFHFNILKRHMVIISEQVDKVIAHLKCQGTEAAIDVVPFCSNITLNIVCESSMGVALDGTGDKESKEAYKKAIEDIVSLIIYKAMRPYIKNWVLWFMPRLRNKMKTALRTINDFTDKIIEQRRQYHKDAHYKYLEQLQDDAEDSSDDCDNIRYNNKKRRLAMLDLLLAAERDNLIDHDGIKEEVSTFIFAGHDTTGMALSYSLILLAEHEDIQNRARKEVEEIVKRKGAKFEYSDLKAMVYLERCIKESLRLLPPVPSVTRHMAEDLQLKHGLAPKGSDIVLNFVDAHRDANYWPEPDKFEPDRFLPDEASRRHPFAYLPFSAGLRNCIGQKLAMMELKYVIAHVLYNFDLEPIDRLKDFRLKIDLILRPDHPVLAKFVQINRN